MNRFYTYTEAADLFDVSKSTIVRIVGELGLKPRKTGNRYILTAEELAAVQDSLIERKLMDSDDSINVSEQIKIVKDINANNSVDISNSDSSQDDNTSASEEQCTSNDEDALTNLIRVFEKELDAKNEQLRKADEEVQRMMQNTEKLYALIEKEKAEKEAIRQQLLQVQNQNAFYQQLQITEKAEMKQTPSRDDYEEETPKKKKKGLFGLFGKG